MKSTDFQNFHAVQMIVNQLTYFEKFFFHLWDIQFQQLIHLYRVQQKMLIDNYNSEQQQGSSLSKDIVHLKSIKEIFYSGSSFHQSRFQYGNKESIMSLKMKGFVIRGLLCKNGLWDQQNLKKQKQHMFYQWYAQTSGNRFQTAINKFVTSGRIRKEKVFYMLKIMANRTISDQKQTSKGKDGLEKQKNQSRNNQIKQQEKIKKVATTEQKKNKKVKMNQNSKFQSSINHILLQVDSILSLSSGKQNDVMEEQIKKSSVHYPTAGYHSRPIIKKTADEMIYTQRYNQQNSKNKSSISYIEPASGSRQIDLLTCTNLLLQQKQQKKETRISQKKSSAIQLLRIFDKLQLKLLIVGFKNLFLNSLQEDYEQQLLKARRNLQLVELNYMVECQIKQIQQNYDQQNEHLQSIDKNLSILRQKFTFSRTSGLIRAIKKVIYPQLIEGFNNLVELFESHQQNANFYEVQQLGGSLSNFSCSSNSDSHIDFMQKYNKRQGEQIKYGQSNKKKFKRVSLFEEDFIQEQKQNQNRCSSDQS